MLCHAGAKSLAQVASARQSWTLTGEEREMNTEIIRAKVIDRPPMLQRRRAGYRWPRRPRNWSLGDGWVSCP